MKNYKIYSAAALLAAGLMSGFGFGMDKEVSASNNLNINTSVVGINRFEKNGWYTIVSKKSRERDGNKIYFDEGGGHLYTSHCNYEDSNRNYSFNAQTVNNPHVMWRMEKIETSFPQNASAYTIIDDIKHSQLDQNLFDTLLAESNYGEAYRMAANNGQGNLWRRQAVARAKTDIKRLVWSGIARDEADDLNGATQIINGFAGIAVHGELLTLFNQTRATAQLKKTQLLQNPQVSLLADALKADLISQLLG